MDGRVPAVRDQNAQNWSEREKFAKLTLSNDPELDESAKVMTAHCKIRYESIFLDANPDMDKVTPISLSAKPKDSTHRYSGAVREKCLLARCHR
jgi:hypothetical protein